MRLNLIRTFAFFTLLLSAGQVFGQTIRTIAGNGIADSTGGDRGPATNASMGQIFGVAIDSIGNIYICDNFYNNIRKVTPQGIITTIAGDIDGYPSYRGDGGAAVASFLNAPQCIDCDRAGNLYIADAANRRIRKIDLAGNINTVAGISATGYYNGDGIPATTAMIGSPAGVRVDSLGNIFIGDGNTRIRKVNTSGIISTVAGNGTVGYGSSGGAATSRALDGTIGVCMDPSGNIYFADKNNDVVRKVSTSGILTNFAGTSTAGFSGDGGQASSARLNGPHGVRADKFGNIYIADQGNQRIRRVDRSGIIRTIAGSNSSPDFSGDGGPATAARLANPSDICFDAHGNIYIADRGAGVSTSVGHRIRQIFTVDTFHISASPNDTVCGRPAVVFTAHPTIPHYNSKFVWYLNGSPVGFDSAVYRPASLSNGDVITCTIIDPNYSSMVLAVSDTIRMVIRPAVIPRISMLTTGDTLCAGETVTLTTAVANEGTAPSYLWQRFGVTIGTGPTLTYVPMYGDIITVILQSNAVCAIPDTAMATRPMYVNISYPPLITLDAHPNDTIAYYGEIVTLFSETTYGGSAPTYQWYRNGRVISGATNSTFSEEVYYNDTLYCVMHSNLPCVVPEYDTSNVVYISVGALSVTDLENRIQRIEVYPNPTDGQLTLRGLGKIEKNTSLSLHLRDINGRTVFSDVLLTSGTATQPIKLPSTITDGIYYLSVTEGDNQMGIPIVIKK